MDTYRFSLWNMALLVLLGGGPALGKDDQPIRRTERPATAAIRRPFPLIALGDRLLVGNTRSGTVSEIDITTHRVVAEHSVASQLAHMVAHPGLPDAFVLDDVDNRLLAITLKEHRLAVKTIRELSAPPSRMVVSQTLCQVLISSRWSRCITIVSFDNAFEQALAIQEIRLEFAPQELLLIEHQQKLLVADAFGGRLALIDLSSKTIDQVYNLPAHNIRGLAISPDKSTLLISHQTLHPQSWADRDSVHWGILLNNQVRGIPLAALSGQQQDLLQDGWLEQLGLVGQAAGDPGPILIDNKQRQVIAFSGVAEVRINASSYALTLPVGRRPMGLAVADDYLFIANQFDDSVSVIDLALGHNVETIPLGQIPPLSPRDRGEVLFYDAHLSHDRWMSCHSCHSEGHTIGLLADTLGDGNYGTAKRIPSLLGTTTSGPWSWNGQTSSLYQQVHNSVLSTMHGSQLSEDQANDLVAFLESLQPPPSRYPSKLAMVKLGQRVFENRGCVDCHTPPAFTSSDTYDVGMADETGTRLFNPPSLLGLGQRDLFFHDGRVTRVEDVIHKVQHQLDEPLSGPEAVALVAFLQSL